MQHTLEDVYIHLVLEARTRNTDTSNNIQTRKRVHKPISPDSDRYTNRRISKQKVEWGVGNMFETMHDTGLKKQVANTILGWFDTLPVTIQQYIRYDITNLRTNRFKFNHGWLDKLRIAVINNNTQKQQTILNIFTTKNVIDQQTANTFLTQSPDEQLQTIEKWGNIKAQTNPLFNDNAAREFLESDANTQMKIFKRWIVNTLPGSIGQKFFMNTLHMDDGDVISTIMHQMYNTNE